MHHKGVPETVGPVTTSRSGGEQLSGEAHPCNFPGCLKDSSTVCQECCRKCSLRDEMTFCVDHNHKSHEAIIDEIINKVTLNGFLMLRPPVMKIEVFSLLHAKHEEACQQGQQADNSNNNTLVDVQVN